MTNLEAKKEAIKKAYGEHYDNLKKYLNGFMVDRVNYERETGNKLSDLKGIDFIHEPLVYSYPDVVEGFQNNNGWIRIESEDDLPKDYNVSEFHLWLWTNNGIYKMQDYKIWKLYYDVLKVSHYRLEPIFKPNPPIF